MSEMGEAAGPQRRWDDGDDRERLATLETIVKDIPLMRQRLHDMATDVAVLVDAAERAERSHGDMLAEIRAARAEARSELAQHDLRDDTRFAGVDRQLATIGTRLGVHDAVEESEQRFTERRHGQHISLQAALIGATVALLSAIVVAVLTPLCERLFH
jgi:hypothetical protein